MLVSCVRFTPATSFIDEASATWNDIAEPISFEVVLLSCFWFVNNVAQITGLLDFGFPGRWIWELWSSQKSWFFLERYFFSFSLRKYLLTRAVSCCILLSSWVNQSQHFVALCLASIWNGWTINSSGQCSQAWKAMRSFRSVSFFGFYSSEQFSWRPIELLESSYVPFYLSPHAFEALRASKPLKNLSACLFLM